ncbi:MAG TPA: glycosyltransferase family 4 protein [Methyloceanibacter sp.]
MILGRIDTPEAGSRTVKGPTVVRGWAYSAISPVSAVEIRLNGCPLGRAGLGRARPEIAEALGDPAAELSGFELHFDLREVSKLGERISLTASVTLLDNNSADLPAIEITIAPPVRHDPALAESASRESPSGAPSRRRLREILRPQPIRLLCFERSLGFGGSQLRLSELVHHLGKTGRFKKITVISPTEGPLRQELEAAGATVRVRPIPTDDAGLYDRKLADLAEWAKGGFDLVLAFTLSGFPGIELAEQLGLPSVWRIGEAEPLSTVVDWLQETLDPTLELRARRAFSAASLVLFNSQAALDLHRRYCPDRRFAVLSSGVDVTGARDYLRSVKRDACRRSLGLADDERLLVCAATVWPVKGQALLVAAMAQICAEYSNLRCVLIGERVGMYAEAVSRSIDRLGLSGSVRMLPFCEDLRPWWSAADASLCCSESESMSASTLEAMAFGLPVLATRVGGLPEVVEDGVTGWLCEPNDLGSMIAGLKRVATADKAALGALGKRASLRVRRSHSRAVASARMTKLLQRLARGSLPR